MSQSADVQSMLAAAEGAATAGDLAAAAELLSDAARIQEAELGPLHPDLANTLNNLAVVAERSGRPDDAETFYRRAVAIASSSLPPDDPMLAASRQNLEDFCRARGLPIDAAAATEPTAEDLPFEPHTSAPEELPKATATASTPIARLPSRPARRRWTSPATLAIAAVILLAAVLMMIRPRSSRTTSTASPTAQPAPAQVAEPPRAAPAESPPVEQPRPTTADEARPPGRASGAISLVAVQVCRSFSTTGGNWRCEPAGESVAPGPIVLYTRVRSTSDGAVVHRWYRGDTLRQSVRLRVGANATEGYRTYSRQTVDRGDWRIEVRSVAGELLHEQRFTVR